MDNTTTLTLIFHRDTLEVEINAPEMPLDFGISLLERAKRVLEAQEKLVIAQQMGAVAAQVRDNADRTKRVISNLKM
jgi:hypothetical protein